MNTINSLSTLKFIIGAVNVVFQVLLLLILVYYGFISLFGLVRRKEPSAFSFPIKNKFAVLISAHNEELVIGKSIECLKSVNYPSHMYDIYVIADNCDDATAEVARKHGAIVYERFDDKRKGKGFALKWMFEKLAEMDEKYDAVCILDADNLVSSNFFLEMNKQLQMGHSVIQGYLDSKNPYDTWVSGNYSISYWISNRLFQLPRYYLGLSCALGGTGFVMTMDVLNELGWDATCLTEDLEFSMKLVLNGKRVAWAHDAKVYDEKPLKLLQSLRQRKRWMQGHSDCATRFFKKLLIKGIKDKDMAAIDSALYLLQPFIIVANGIFMAVSALNILLFSNLDKIFSVKGILAIILTLIFTYISIIFVFIEGKLTSKIAKYFLTLPIYSITWIPIALLGMIDKDKKEWVHTLHTRSLDIADVEKAK